MKMIAIMTIIQEEGYDGGGVKVRIKLKITAIKAVNTMAQNTSSINGYNFLVGSAIAPRSS